MATRTASQDKLIEAAIAVFGDKGYEGTSTRDIAAAAGVNHAAISYYFSGKEALYAACLDAIAVECRAEMGDIPRHLQAAMQGGKADRDLCWAAIESFIETMTHMFLSRDVHTARSRVMLREMIDPTPAFDRLYEAFMKEMSDSLTRIVACLTGLRPTSRDAIFCTHAVFGQIKTFQHSRAILQRRLGITEYSDKDIKDIIKVLKINTRGIVQAWTDRAEQRRRT